MEHHLNRLVLNKQNYYKTFTLYSFHYGVPQNFSVYFTDAYPKTKPVFEFETNISISLDGTGYALTLLLVSQIIIFGMVIFAGVFNEED